MINIKTWVSGTQRTRSKLDPVNKTSDYVPLKIVSLSGLSSVLADFSSFSLFSSLLDAGPGTE